MTTLLSPAGKPVSIRAWPLAGTQATSATTYAHQRKSIRLFDGVGDSLRFKGFEELYRTQPFIHAAVQVKARGLANLPLRVRTVDDDGGFTVIDPERDAQAGALPGEVRLALMLGRRPNPDMSAFELKLRIAIDLQVYGNCLLKIVRDSRGIITELWHIPWRDVRVILGVDLPIMGYEVIVARGPNPTFAPEEVVHLGRGSDPASPLGVSPLQPLAETAGLMEGMQRYLRSFFQQAVRPAANLKLPAGTSAEAIAMARDQLAEQSEGVDQAGKTMITTGDFQPISAEPQHTQVIEILSVSREEVSAVLGVPPPLLAQLDGAIMSNVGHLREHYYRDVVGPFATGIEDDLMTQLLPRSESWKGLVVGFDLDEMLAPDMAARASAYRSLRYVYTTNELREKEGLPRIDDRRADTVWLPASEVPLDGEEAPPEPPAGWGEQEQPEQPAPGEPPEGNGGPGGDPMDEPEG